ITVLLIVGTMLWT
nr:immunoglobulin heavy chain junction region [Mus musculus]